MKVKLIGAFGFVFLLNNILVYIFFFKGSVLKIGEGDSQ